jgi:hypothetical protein
LVSAPGLGPGGQRFESARPDLCSSFARSIMRVCELLLPIALMFAGDADQLTEVKIENAKLRVLLPAEPEMMTQKLPNGVPLRMYLARSANALFIVATMDLPESANESEEKLQERLDTARDLAVQNSKGKLLKETRIKLANKHPGREALIELPSGQGVVRQRIYLADGRMYQLMIVGSPEAANAAGKFLDSLVVNK